MELKIWSSGTALIRTLLLGLLLACAGSKKMANGIGVNYGMVANDLPPPVEVVQLLKTTSLDSVKLYTSNPEVLTAFAETGINIVVGIENELVPILAKSSRAARVWVNQHIQPYFPATSITDIAVGNEVLTSKVPSLIAQLVPAMENLQQALTVLGVHEKIRVSTPNSMAVLSSSTPPSSGVFDPSLLPTIQQLLQFLSHSGSTFMVNAYPYFAYAADPQGVALDFALFRAKVGVKDAGSGLTYGSLFDAQVDAVYFAIKAAGYDGTVPVVVSESGWPSSGDSNETGAGMVNAQIYNSNLVKRVDSNIGTPFKPLLPIPTFIFGLFNENLKPGPSSERHFGLFLPNKAVVYDAGISKATAPGTNPGSGPSSVPSPVVGQPTNGVWCVVGPSATEETLQFTLNFACNNGEADCTAIQPGQPCFNPNTLAAHASYAMNSYYQRHGRNYWNCFFNSSGLVTATNPSYASCNYPSQ